MNELLSRISSYNLFNYLFPGVLFAVSGEQLTHWHFLHENTIITLFLCYFYGTVISRIGSLIIEPVLIKGLKRSSYNDYTKASKEDTEIKTLSETNNTYRTIVSLVISVSCLYILSILAERNPCLDTVFLFILPIALIVLFVLSYRKQSNYISKRVRAVLGEGESK